MRSSLHLGAAALASLVLVTACGSASSPPQPTALPDSIQAQLQQALDDVQAKFGFPGTMAGVWRPDGEWTGLVGEAGPSPSRPIDLADHTRIGSLTKSFTVTALLQLVDQGLLSLDDTIGEYVPGLPNGGTATLLDLARMTSGILPYTAVEESTDAYFADPTRVWQPAELVDFVKGTDPQFAPGESVQYSNTNTVLLGMVIEKVTGRSMSEVLTDGILGPLGMTGTSFPGESSALPDPHLSGVTTQGNPEGELKDATYWSPTYAYSAGEMISTLDDLHTWGVALGTGEGILSPKMQQLRIDSLTSNIAGNTPERTYGIGMGLTGGWIGHTGEIPGFNTVIEYDPSTQTTVAVIVNSDISVDNATPASAVFTAFDAILH